MQIISLLFAAFLGAVIVYLWLNTILQSVRGKNTKLQVQLDEQAKNYEFIKSSKNQMNDDFKKIADKILSADKAELSQKNQELLKPLDTQLKDFKARMEVMGKAQSDDRSALKQQIESLATANKDTLKGAEKLANALTYDNKQQGDWGEMVLESILQDSGLIKNQQYEIQSGFMDEHGKLFKPDVVVHLPNQQDIVIDAKVSLVAYQKYVQNTQDEAALKAHIQSIDNHIKNISLKSYENLQGVRTLDFIFVFFPIEASLLVALEKKPSLFNDALKKNVALISPSTLMMSLRTVHHLWQTEKQNKNTEEIVRQASNMYDGFVRFVESLEEVKKHLNKAVESHTKAQERLTSGKGNLFKRAQKLKELGIQTKKQLSE